MSVGVTLLFFLAFRVLDKLCQKKNLVAECNKYLCDMLDTYDYLYVIDEKSDRVLSEKDLELPVVFYRLISVHDKIGMVAFCHVRV